MTKPLESRPWARPVRRSRRILVLVVALAVIGLVAGGSLYYLSTNGTPSNSTGPSTVKVQLGAVTLGRTGCGGNVSLYTETLLWLGASSNLSTSGVRFTIQEVGDGDVIGTNAPAADVGASSLCLGSPPLATYAWYLVLQAPGHGAYSAVYTYSQLWTSVNNGPLPVALLPGSSLIVVCTSNLSGSDYALEISGVPGATPVTGYSGL